MFWTPSTQCLNLFSKTEKKKSAPVFGSFMLFVMPEGSQTQILTSDVGVKAVSDQENNLRMKKGICKQ